MKAFIILPAAVMAMGFVTIPVAAQQTTPSSTPEAPVIAKQSPPPEGSAEQAAQHQREHERAVAAGDHANDPLNPTSSNFLNRRELQRVQALGSGLTYADPEDTMPRHTPIKGLPPDNIEDGSVESLPPESTPTGQVPPFPQPAIPADDPLAPNSGLK